MILSKLTLAHWLSLFTIISLISMGSFVLISDGLQDVFPGWKKWSFGFVTIGYAILRLLRIRKQILS